jgi:hypothetical protein
MNNIKIAFDPKTGLYMGSNQDLRSVSNRRVLVNEEEIQNPFGTSMVVLKEKPSKIISITMGKNAVGWEDLKTGKTISHEEYNSLRNELTSKGTLDDDNEWEFDEVEDQVNFLRFDKTWTRKYTDEPVISEFEIEIIEHPVSEIPEIVGSFHAGGNSIFDTVCTYSVNSGKLFRDRCEHFGLTKAKNDSEKGNVYYLEDRYDNFRFAKLGGSYCTNDESVRMVRASARGSYEELKRVHEKNIEIVDSIISKWISKQDQKTLDIVTVGKQISFLDSILSKVISLDVKRADLSSQRSIIQSIRENLESLTSNSK